MLQKLTRNSLLATAVGILGAGTFAPPSADAAILTMELRAVQTSPSGNSTALVTSPKSAEAIAVGQTVVLELVARITNTDAGNTTAGRTDERYQRTSGGISSTEFSPVSVRGDISPFLFNSFANNDPDDPDNDIFTQGSFVLDGAVSTPGEQRNIDGNPDLELRGADPQAAPGWVDLSSGTTPKNGSTATQTSGDTLFVLGRTTWTATFASLAGTALNWFPRPFISALDNGELFKFTSEGTTYSVKFDDPNFNDLVAAGEPVIINFPEPAGLGILGIGAMAVVARRRCVR